MCSLKKRVLNDAYIDLRSFNGKLFLAHYELSVIFPKNQACIDMS